ncbi:MAG: hypothetical protein KAU29_12545 [Gammaproteobacteria bacterium]|nr:hypothetical protein [Gammaproteobacteria bacterium]
MKKVLLGFVIIGFLGGCANPPVKIDISTAEELPKDIALKYLNDITEEYKGFVHYSFNNIICIFNKDGFYKTGSGPDKISKYEQSYMRLQLVHVPGSFYPYYFWLHTDSGNPFDECLVTETEPGAKMEKPHKLFVKIPTALKSLGVKVEPKK